MIRSSNSTPFFILLGAVIYTGAFFLPFSFASNDDSLMMGLLNGSYTGSPEGYVVFIHPLLSESISYLYRLNNGFPWYPFLWFVFSFLSYAAFVLAVGIRRYNIIYQLLCIVLYLLFSLHQLFLLQFTVVAGVLAFSGYILLLEGQIFSSKRHVWEVIFASSLIILSVLVRVEAFVLVTIGLGSFFLFRYGFLKSVSLLRRNAWLVVTAIALYGLVPIYEKAFGYEEYARFTKVRSKVIDHPVFWYITPQIDKEATPDLFFFRNWLFEDNPAVDISLLEKAKEQLDDGHFSLGYFYYSFQRIIDFHKHHRFAFFTTLCYISFFLLLDSHKWRNFKFLLLWGAFFLLFNHFYLVPHRVQSLFGLVICGASWLCQRKLNLHPQYVGVIVSAILCVFLVHVLRITQSLTLKEKSINEFKFIKQFIPQEAIGFTDLIGVEHLDPKVPSHEESQFVYFGWHSRSPMQTKTLGKFGYGSLKEVEEFYYLTLCDNKLIIPEYLSYLSEEEFRREFVASKGEFLLYKYSR